MKKTIYHPKRALRNIAWQMLPHPSECEHQCEVIAHPLGDALKRCVHCGRLEAQ